jgi:putative ABC transport system permease protein
MWLFRFLVKLYPAGFHSEFAKAMEQQFEDDWRSASGPFAKLALLAKALWELLWVWPQVRSSEFAQDARYCWRSWRKRSAVTLLAVLSLGMAIGVSTGVFSVVNAMLYRQLPFRQPERLVHFRSYFSPSFEGRNAFFAWQKEHPFLEDSAVLGSSEVNLSLKPHAIRVTTAETSANFFRLLGTPIYLGRDFLPDEDVKGSRGVAIIAYSLFEQAFGGDRGLLGRTILLNKQPFTVVGIAPPAFDYPDNAAVWVPTGFQPDRIPKSGVASMFTMGRLRADLTFAAATPQFQAIAARNKQYSFPGGNDEANRPKMLSLYNYITVEYRDAIWILFAGVGAVLLIACTNLSHLLLTRFAERESEFRIRSWLGAGQGRIRQQVLTECILLSLAAGFFSLVFSHLTLQIGTHYFPPQFAFQRYEIFEGPVLGFTLAVSLLCGLSFSLGPLLLRRDSSTRWAPKLKLTLLSVQVCVSALLLTSAFSLGRGMLQLHKVDLGYKTEDVYTATVSLVTTAHENKADDYVSNALEQLRRLPQVESVGAIDFLPLAAKSFMAGLYDVSKSRNPELAIHLSATPGTLNATSAKLLAGRDFQPQDTAKSLPVVIVNESYAKLEGGTSQVIGRKLKHSRNFGETGPPETVIGVVSDFRYAGPAEGTNSTVIRPFSQKPQKFFTVTVRARAGATGMEALIRSTLESIDATVPVYDVMPFDQRLDRALARPHFFQIVLVFFGAFSLLLTLIHGYSLCATTLEQRRREMGIRSALGATTTALRWLILSQMVPALGIGLGGAFLLSGWTTDSLKALAASIEELPVLWRAGVMSCLCLFGVLTIWLKTRSLLRLSPAETLRAD